MNGVSIPVWMILVVVSSDMTPVICENVKISKNELIVKMILKNL